MRPAPLLLVLLLAWSLLGLPVAAGSKQRKSDDTVVIDSIVGDVAGRHAIVLDDEIATGGSIVELLDKLEELGCPLDELTAVYTSGSMLVFLAAAPEDGQEGPIEAC